MGRKPIARDKVLELLAEYGVVNASGVAELTDFSRGTIAQAILTLAEMGEIVPHPATKGAWMLAPEKKGQDDQ